MGADIRFAVGSSSASRRIRTASTSVVRERDGDADADRAVCGTWSAPTAPAAGSSARAGLTVEEPDDLARAANIWFRADLSRYLAHRPGVLTWNVMPGPLPPLRLGTLICHKPFTEFVLAFMYDPAQVSLDALGTGELRERIRAFVGEDVDAEILGVAGWQVRAQIASAYAAGRVFCMGDAVHRHPPTNGLGLNMSIADAYNLGWKLALVLAGRAGAALLDSYSRNDSRSGRRASSAPSPACRKEPRSRPPSGTSRASPPRRAGRPSVPCTSQGRPGTSAGTRCARRSS